VGCSADPFPVEPELAHPRRANVEAARRGFGD
jgi:hypothetical protein